MSQACSGIPHTSTAPYAWGFVDESGSRAAMVDWVHVSMDMSGEMVRSLAAMKLIVMAQAVAVYSSNTKTPASHSYLDSAVLYSCHHTRLSLRVPQLLSQPQPRLQGASKAVRHMVVGVVPGAAIGEKVVCHPCYLG